MPQMFPSSALFYFMLMIMFFFLFMAFMYWMSPIMKSMSSEVFKFNLEKTNKYMW